jgi:hypothetical protein
MTPYFRIFLTIMLLFIVGAYALAQDVPYSMCGVTTTGVVLRETTDVFETKMMSCRPAPIGSGTFPTIRYNAAGVTVWWYCKAPSGRWVPNWIAATASQFNAIKAAGEAYTALITPDPLDTLNAVAVKNFTLPIDDPELLRVWCPHEREMFAGRPKPDPLPAPPPVWLVAKNSGYPTRPAYTPTGAALGVSTGRATVGAVCSGTVLVIGSTTYMPFAGGAAGQVAVCSKV